MSEITAGWYDGKATAWEWTQAKTGTWQLHITFALSANGVDAGTLPGWFAVTDNTIEKRVEQFAALGYVPKSGDIGEEIGSDENGRWGGLDRNTVRVVVAPDTNGRMRVDNICKPNAARPPADAAKLKAFGAQMRGAVLAAAKRAEAAAGVAPTQRPAPQRAPAPRQLPRGFDAGEGEDSIPF